MKNKYDLYEQDEYAKVYEKATLAVDKAINDFVLELRKIDEKYPCGLSDTASRDCLIEAVTDAIVAEL